MPHIDNDIKLDFKDVLLRPKRSTLKSRSEVDLLRSFTFRNSKQTYRGIPIIAANMDTVGTFEMAKVLSKFSLFTAIHKHCTVEEWQEFAAQHPDCLQNVAASTGTSDLEHLERVLEAVPQIRYICLDVANGYSEHFVQFLRDLRKRYPDHTIMAGNVVTGEMVEELILSGADIIKVGIGPGSVCTTRKKTGVGYPQLSAVMECADAAHGLGGHIISDGGCHCPGDVAKAFGAGADFVMVGGMLAGHTESGGDLIEKEGKKYKLFYGMSSEVSMKKYAGGVADYRSLVIQWHTDDKARPQTRSQTTAASLATLNPSNPYMKQTETHHEDAARPRTRSQKIAMQFTILNPPATQTNLSTTKPPPKQNTPPANQNTANPPNQSEHSQAPSQSEYTSIQSEHSQALIQSLDTPTGS